MATSLTTTYHGSITLTSSGSYTSPLTITATGNVDPSSGASSAVSSELVGVTLVNEGSINTAYNAEAGVQFSNGGFVSNSGTSAVISGDTYGVYIYGPNGTNAIVTNAGTIAGPAGSGVHIFGSGTVSNVGTGALITGGYAGLYLESGTLTVSNAGTIESMSRNGIQLGYSATGTITNSGLIYGVIFGIVMGNANATVTNAGTISGGTDAIIFGYAGNNMLIVDPGAVFGGHVVGYGSGNVLALAGTLAGTIAGIANTLGHAAMFDDFATIAFDTGAQWTASGAYGDLAGEVVTGFGVGDTLELDGFAATSDTYVTGTGLELGNGTTRVTLDITGSFATADFSVTEPAASTTAIAVHCYGRGTRIETPEGDIAIEDLRIGDVVITAAGAARPIIWIGTRQFDPSFVGRNPDVLPIRICRDALADGIPRRDLLVSPEHAMLIDGVLIAAKHLINGVSIRQEEPGSIIEYFHLELDTHDAILAEGAASETYVEDGDRGMFHNAASRRCETLAPAQYCAQRLDAGSNLDAIRARIDERAGLRAVTTPDPDIHLLADGTVIRPSEERNGVFVFALPCPARDIVLVSRRADQAGADRRGLGVAVAAITIDGLPIDPATLGEPGWHRPERDGERHWRWTNGAAALPAVGKACRIEVTAGAAQHYRTHHDVGNLAA